MDFTLNSKPVSIEVREGATLLELLREGCGVTSVKDGCAPEGSCGACTVMSDATSIRATSPSIVLTRASYCERPSIPGSLVCPSTRWE